MLCIHIEGSNASSEPTTPARMGGDGSVSRVCSESRVCATVVAHDRGWNMATLPASEGVGQFEPIHRLSGAVHASNCTMLRLKGSLAYVMYQARVF